mgnify:CR=1 FL=1
MAITKEEILDAISEMSVMDVVDLVKLQKERALFWETENEVEIKRW